MIYFSTKYHLNYYLLFKFFTENCKQNVILKGRLTIANSDLLFFVLTNIRIQSKTYGNHYSSLISCCINIRIEEQIMNSLII